MPLPKNETNQYFKIKLCNTISYFSFKEVGLQRRQLNYRTITVRINNNIINIQIKIS